VWDIAAFIVDRAHRCVAGCVQFVEFTAAAGLVEFRCGLASRYDDDESHDPARRFARRRSIAAY
jgi:hypothetical protein